MEGKHFSVNSTCTLPSIVQYYIHFFKIQKNDTLHLPVIAAAYRMTPRLRSLKQQVFHSITWMVQVRDWGGSSAYDLPEVTQCPLLVDGMAFTHMSIPRRGGWLEYCAKRHILKETTDMCPL